MKYLYTYNESIKNYLKPKSEEEINTALNNLSPSQKILKGSEHNLLWLVKQGFEEGGDPSIENSFALPHAVSNNNIEIVKLLLNDERTDPSKTANFAVRIAAGEGFTEIFKLLMEDDRVNPSDWNCDAIVKAARNKHYDIVKILLSNKKIRRKLGKYMIKHYENLLKDNID